MVNVEINRVKALIWSLVQGPSGPDDRLSCTLLQASNTVHHEVLVSCLSHLSNITVQHSLTSPWQLALISFKTEISRFSWSPMSLHIGQTVGITWFARSFMEGFSPAFSVTWRMTITISSPLQLYNWQTGVVNIIINISTWHNWTWNICCWICFFRVLLWT